jgi:hypothetical protein
MIFYQVFRKSFLLYSAQQLICRNCKRLREFEDIEISEISRQSCRGDCEYLLKILSGFGPIIRPLVTYQSQGLKHINRGRISQFSMLQETALCTLYYVLSLH